MNRIISILSLESARSQYKCNFTVVIFKSPLALFFFNLKIKSLSLNHMSSITTKSVFGVSD